MDFGKPTTSTDNPVGPPEAATIHAIQSNDQRATAEFVRANAPWMLALATRLTGDQFFAEDCVQEAFTNAFRAIGQFEGKSSLRGWLHRIVVNQALMKLRTRKRQREDSLDDLLPEFDENACRVETPWSILATPEEIFERADLRNFIHEKIDALPESYRLILRLRDIEEMTTIEVATALDLSESNVKVRLHRARSALKKLLEPVLRGEL